MFKWFGKNASQKKKNEAPRRESLRRIERIEIQTKLSSLDKRQQTLKEENESLVRKLEELETKYNNLVLRCVLVSFFGFGVFIAGSVENLWNAMLSEYNRVSTQSAQIHTMFGKEVELKYTARAIALCLFFVILFVTWPILNFVTSIGLYMLRTILRKKALFFLALLLLTASMGAMWYYEYTDEVQEYYESAVGNASALLDSIITISSKKQDL